MTAWGINKSQINGLKTTLESPACLPRLSRPSAPGVDGRPGLPLWTWASSDGTVQGTSLPGARLLLLWFLATVYNVSTSQCLHRRRGTQWLDLSCVLPAPAGAGGGQGSLQPKKPKHAHGLLSHCLYGINTRFQRFQNCKTLQILKYLFQVTIF